MNAQHFPFGLFAITAIAAGTGKYKLAASASGYITKALPLADISVASQSNVKFALRP